jgi:hypothetical protein
MEMERRVPCALFASYKIFRIVVNINLLKPSGNFTYDQV